MSSRLASSLWSAGRGLVAIATLAACRFGGPSADPNAYVSFPSDASVDSDASGTDSTDATIGTPDTDGTPDDSPTEEAATADAHDDDEAGRDGGPSTGPGADGGACGATIAVCNPIHNTGCNPFQQCDVDLTQKTTPTGVCVFNSGQPEGGPCSTGAFSESCDPEFTCVSSACRQLCACDSDCANGGCCSDTSGPPGFTLCEPCP